MTQVEENPKQVVHVLDESAEGTTVKIRRLYEPLFVELHRRAKPVIVDFTSDLSHDAITLAFAKVGEKFMWGVRESGTTLINIRRTPRIYLPVYLETCPVNNWHLLEVTCVRDVGQADGFATWTNSQDVDHLMKVIDENI